MTNQTSKLRTLGMALADLAQEIGEPPLICEGYECGAAFMIDSVTRRFKLREEQIDGYERQLGIADAGAERTIGSEIERLLHPETPAEPEGYPGIAHDLQTARNDLAALRHWVKEAAVCAGLIPAVKTSAEPCTFPDCRHKDVTECGKP